MPKRIPTARPVGLPRPAGPKPDLRPSAAKRGYGRKWRAARAVYLEQNPFCADCLSRGEYVLATVVDHKKPHRGDAGLFWDRSNWQSLCKRSHDRKTAKRDGGFGRKRL